MKDKLDIFIGTHKTFEPKVTNEVYKIIVGNHQIENKSNLELINCKHEEALDDRFYSEIYMLKWLADNYKLKDYVGFCHYRKIWGFMDNIPNLDEIFKKYEIIAGKQIKVPRSNREQYRLCHNIEDLYILSGIISELYPDYVKTWNTFLNDNKMFPYNMFIMKREEFLEYINFIKTILDKYVEVVGDKIFKRIYDNYEHYIKRYYPNSDVEYQYRIGGYLAERLTNIWILKNHTNIGVASVLITESKYRKTKVETSGTTKETSGKTTEEKKSS